MSQRQPSSAQPVLVCTLNNSIHGDCGNESEKTFSKQGEDKTNPMDFAMDHRKWRGSKEHAVMFLLNQKLSQMDKNLLSTLWVKL
jgi:hypothetical protein